MAAPRRFEFFASASTIADPDAFKGVVGYRPTVGRKKCAREIAAAIDWYRAETDDPSFKAFVGDLRDMLRAFRDAASR